MKTSVKTQFSNSKIDSSLVDTTRFQDAMDVMISKGKGLSGIGTLAEKGIHAVLKYYYVPNEVNHEIRISENGSNSGYIADAILDGEIYEIQSKAFHLLRGKLDEFLKEHDVTIIYPIAVSKMLHYIVPETGEVISSRKSSKKGSLYELIPELYKIKKYLTNERLHIIATFINSEEYLFWDGRGKSKTTKATKIDRIPTEILGEFRINNINDYLNFLPGFKNGKRQKDCHIPELFTTKDIEELSGFHKSYAQILLNILCELKLINKQGKLGRYFAYSFAKRSR